MQKLSVAIVCKNEEDNISRCLQSVKWADEIVVVDSGSTDNTIKICRDFGCRVIESEWLGFGKTKALAVSSVSNDWVLSIDADEVVSESLRDRITVILGTKDRKDAYKIRFILYYLDKKIRFSGVRNEYHIRLFNRQKGGINKSSLHEGIETSGEVGLIKAPVYHYSYPKIAVHIEKIRRYSALAAKKKFKDGKSVSLFTVFFRVFFTFFRNYILLGGILDGKVGLILNINSAIYTYFSYLFLWELNRK